MYVDEFSGPVFVSASPIALNSCEMLFRITNKWSKFVKLPSIFRKNDDNKLLQSVESLVFNSSSCLLSSLAVYDLHWLSMLHALTAS